jgi:hypothetical protein
MRSPSKCERSLARRPLTCQSAPISIDEENRPDQPWLRIESGQKRGLVEPMEAVRIRDGLRRAGGSTEEQLATIIDAKATELLAAPLYAGTVSVRIDTQEEECLRDLLTRWVADGSVSELETGRLWQLWGELGGVAVE